VLIFDISSAELINKISRKECGAIWSMDISQEDTILAIGYENAKIELIDLVKAKVNNSEKYVLNTYKTKQTSILCLKFSYENLLLAISSFVVETR